MKDILDNACRLAREAGARIMPFYGGAVDVKSKDDKSPLTAADLASHQFLVQSLPALLPGTPVVSEESAGQVHAAAVGAGRFWLVDPLDGTKEFLKATGEFTVNIALVENGQPILGVVFAPAIDVLYCAAADTGAWRVKDGGAAARVAVRKADRARMKLVASKDHAGPAVKAMLDKLPGAGLLSMGSSLKFCLVAEGSADLYPRDLPTMEWDTAAAQCVVECAGGRVFALGGEPLRYGKPELRNPGFIAMGDPAFEWRDLICAA